MSHTYELLIDSSQTLQEAGLYNMQVYNEQKRMYRIISPDILLL